MKSQGESVAPQQDWPPTNQSQKQCVTALEVEPTYIISVFLSTYSPIRLQKPAWRVDASTLRDLKQPGSHGRRDSLPIVISESHFFSKVFIVN